MKTHITFVLDSSGSMASIADDTKGGFNYFLAEQCEEDGTATVSLYDFNTHVNRVYRGIPVEEAPKLTTENYSLSGQTALFDAITLAVDETTDHIAGQAVDDRPDNVIVVVLTDGMENASETSQDVVRERVESRQEDHGWEFLFIGANQDAALTATSMGMRADHSLDMSDTGEGTRAAYESTSRNISQARREGRTDGFTDEDRRRQDDADDS